MSLNGLFSKKMFMSRVCRRCLKPFPYFRQIIRPRIRPETQAHSPVLPNPVGLLTKTKNQPEIFEIS
jgi:hypothetical protein